MESSQAPKIWQLEVFFLSLGGIGFAPTAPGTWASLFTLLPLWGLGKFSVPLVLLIPFLIILTLGSCFLSDVCQRRYQTKDPKWIVMDEFLGMTVTWMFWPTESAAHLAIAFALFRFFDIAKVWPVSFFDSMRHGAGVILDDIVAGLMAGILYWPIANYILLPYFHIA